MADLQVREIQVRHGPWDIKALIVEQVSFSSNVDLQSFPRCGGDRRSGATSDDEVQRTGIINQIRAFLLERGVAVRQAAFSKGRDFGAWLGLVPKQISTGDHV